VSAPWASRAGAALLALLFAPARLPAEPPQVEHQPPPCTVPSRPIALCATITDDGQVARARVYFRDAREKFYSFVDMEFGGMNYCGTLPAPREGKIKAIEYYVQGIDDQFESQRTSTYQIAVQPEGVCEFPPLEKDPARAQGIVVHATNRKQGRKLPDGFMAAGVTFVGEDR
jgi:hypothetical protein